MDEQGNLYMGENPPEADLQRLREWEKQTEEEAQRELAEQVTEIERKYKEYIGS